MATSTPWRVNAQPLMPALPAHSPPGNYDIYPVHDIGPGAIGLTHDAIAAAIAGRTHVVIDGFPGVMWDEFRMRLDAALAARNIRATWTRAEALLKPQAEIEALIAPFLGGEDPIFGTRFTGALADFFVGAGVLPDAGVLPEARGVRIHFGCGAALGGWADDPGCLLLYVDVPKNEIQLRARAGTGCVLGAARTDNARRAYKRCYFVDWIAANKHKAALLARLDGYIDEQRPDEVTFIHGAKLRAALTELARSCFRVRPWFEAGPWGGQWMKSRFEQLSRTPPNYAWSFEFIAPENGLTVASNGVALEVSFDLLMYHDRAAVLGDFAERFGDEFPIRFDFLDTFDGGNLSVQCHPRPEYIRRHFGERITQDETYYILENGPQARVYLGFREGVDPAAFRAELERSFAEAAPIDVEKFVNVAPARKHDLFLIPNGTIHCSGRDSLVLEISATPYIFTFKMYDWMRLDLDGRPRPLNIARAFENLYFERAGARANDELISKQRVTAQGAAWQVVHCPTHAHHFYDVHRLEFEGAIDVATHGSPHVLSLVEGATVWVEVGGKRQRYSFAETFTIPAAAGNYRLVSDGAPVKVIKAFIKPASEWVAGSVL